MKVKFRSRLTVIIIGLLTPLTFGLHAATVTVSITGDFSFSPRNRTISPGDTIMWMNDDATTAHTSTSGAPGVPDGVWSSGLLSPGQSFSHTFDSAGTFAYFCSVHTFMTGTIVVQAPQGTGPSVSITSPLNGTTFSSPTNLTVTASASASSGTIAQVEFFDASTSLGVSTTPPYSVTVTNLAAGTHSLTAKATDSGGASAVSTAITVSVGGGGMK
ncbi:MAG TPA: Ig-like domain-containing protein, partial [Verrucomicrobiae bacterium]|nr:Ig-like domain-containing protein [Verrucomicrobiae bacterium]